jgi:CRP-like cAMP-binding protein
MALYNGFEAVARKLTDVLAARVQRIIDAKAARQIEFDEARIARLTALLAKRAARQGQ